MQDRSTTAQAHPNIALLKYWGKQTRPGNLPATPSLSITLDTLTTTTRVTDGREDSVALNGAVVKEAKIIQALADWRRDYDIPPLTISSQNNFPTAAGLASSASGFAALVTAINAHCALGLTSGKRATLARRASASAARSIHGGFVTLSGPDWRGEPLMSAQAWPLKVVIAITSTVPKAVSSTDGMAITRRTSPYFDAWVASTESDYPGIREAVLQRDFNQLATLAEANCLRMHALMMSGDPALIYWNASTLRCIQALRSLRETGAKVLFTIDAGPQVKAICEEGDAAKVQDILSKQEGVQQTMVVGLGGAAKVVGE